MLQILWASLTDIEQTQQWRRYVDAKLGSAERRAVPGGEGVHLHHLPGVFYLHWARLTTKIDK